MLQHQRFWDFLVATLATLPRPLNLMNLTLPRECAVASKGMVPEPITCTAVKHFGDLELS